MDNETAIRVEGVSKKYCKFLKTSMVYGVMDIGRNLVGLSSSPEKLRRSEFWALDNVSFEVKKGEAIGIIGLNGSGKTTLLKLLNGIFWPDKGMISIKGRVGALIEVGAGFHPMLTGLENIYINAAILGMTKKQVDKRFDSIIEFADVGDLIEMPVKFYSSGMFVRLGFAIAVHSEPDILLIDEVLSVGDMNFQNKCVEKIKDMQRRGTTIVFVSHNLDSVVGTCQNALYLKSGTVKIGGNSSKVAMEYRNDINTMLIKRDSIAERSPVLKEINKPVEITNMKLIDSNGDEKTIFITGEELILRIFFSAYKKISNSVFGVTFYKSDGTHIYACNTKYDKIEIAELEGEGMVEYKIPRLNLLSGNYQVTVGIQEETLSVFYDLVEKAFLFKVVQRIHDHGMFYLEHHWNLKDIKMRGGHVI